MATETDKKMYEDVLGVSEIKERLQKRVDLKFKNLYPDVKATIPDVRLKSLQSLCHMC